VECNEVKCNEVETSGMRFRCHTEKIGEGLSSRKPATGWDERASMASA
jgi:hypothetical protein